MNRLGIDIGRVIIDGSAAVGGDTAFFQGSQETMLRTPSVPGAFESIARLVSLVDGQAWLISKCGPRTQQRSLDWLRHHNFFDRTGVADGNYRFCLRRPDKAVHCAELGITHFIDDKPDVHQALAGVVPCRYLFGPQQSGRVPAGVVPVSDWPAAEHAVRASLLDVEPAAGVG
ncbi:hypothetical protein [Kribbella sp. NPDC006257]|uniref:hypothetical protein n=1 Tax=Kribbella sp. NPDC006257 TaxID=3156738 RepID=UPI0033BDAB86